MTKLRRKRIERQVLREISDYAGMSVFWITENQERAKIITRMEREGRIKLTHRRFPWSDAKITKDSK